MEQETRARLEGEVSDLQGMLEAAREQTLVVEARSTELSLACAVELSRREHLENELQDMLAEMALKLDTAEKELERMSQALTKALEEKEQVTKALAALTDKFAALQQRCDDLEQQLLQRDARISFLQTELQSQAAAYEQKLDELNQQMASQMAEYEKQLAPLRTALAQAEADRLRLEQGTSELERIREELAHEAAALKSRALDLEAQLKSAQKHIATVEASALQLEREVSDELSRQAKLLEEKTESLQQECLARDADREKFESQLLALRMEANEHIQEKNEMKSMLKELEDGLVEMESNFNRSMSEAEERFEAVQKERDELRNLSSMLAAKVNMLKGKLARLAANCEPLQEELTAMKKDVKGNSGQFEQQVAEMKAALELVHKSATDDEARFSQERAGWSKERSAWSEVQGQLEGELKHWKDLCGGYQSQYEQSQDQLCEMSLQLKQLQAALSESQDHSLTLVDKVSMETLRRSAIEASLATESELKARHQDQAAKEEDLASLRGELEYTSLALADAMDQKERFALANETLQTEVDMLKEELVAAEWRRVKSEEEMEAVKAGFRIEIQQLEGTQKQMMLDLDSKDRAIVDRNNQILDQAEEFGKKLAFVQFEADADQKRHKAEQHNWASAQIELEAEIETLQQHISDLRKQLATEQVHFGQAEELTAERTRLQQELEELRRKREEERSLHRIEVKELEGMQSEMTNEIDALLERLAAMEQQLNETTDAHEAEVRSLKGSLASEETRRAALEEALQEEQQRRAAEKHEAELSIDALNAEVVQLEAVTSRARSQVSLIERRTLFTAGVVESELSQRAVVEEQLAREVDGLQDALDAQTGMVEELLLAKMSLEADKLKDATEIRSLREDLMASQSQHRIDVQELEGIQNEMTKEIGHQVGIIKGLQADLEHATVTNKAFERELESLRAQLNAGDSELRRRLVVVEGKLNEARGTIDEVTVEREELRGESHRLRRDLTEMQARYAASEASLTDARGAQDRLNNMVASLDSELQRGSLKLEESEQRATDLANIKLGLEESQRLLTRDLDHERRQQRKIKESLQRYVSDVKRNAITSANTTATVLQGMKLDHESLVQNVTDLKSMVDSNAVETSRLNSLLSDATEKLRMARGERDDLDAELLALRQLLKDTQDSMADASELSRMSELLRRNRAEHTDREAESQRVITAGEDAIALMQEELQALRDLSGDSSREFDELRQHFDKDLRALEAQLAQVQLEMSAMEKRYNEERVVSKGLEEALSRSRTDHAALTLETASCLDLLTRHMGSTERDLQMERAALHAEARSYHDLWVEAKPFKAEAEQLVALNAVVENDLQLEHLRVSELEREEAQLQKQCDDLTGELAAERQAYTALGRTNEQLQHDLTTLRRSLLNEQGARIDAEKDLQRSTGRATPPPGVGSPNTALGLSISRSPPRVPSMGSLSGVERDPLDDTFEKRWGDADKAKGKWASRVASPSPQRFASPKFAGALIKSPTKIPQNVVRKYAGHTQTILAVCVAHMDGTEVLFTGSQDWTARGFDVASGECITQYDGHGAALSAVCVAEGSLFTTSHDGTAREWDIASSEMIREFSGGKTTGYSRGFTACCVVDNFLYTSSRDRDRALMKWDLATGIGEVVTSGHVSAITALCSGRGRVFSGGLKGELREWLCVSNQSGHMFEGHFQEITSLCYFDDMLYSGCRDATIKQWDVELGRCVKTFVGHLSVVRSVCASDVGMLSGSADGTVRLWNAETGACKGILQNQDSAVTSLTVAGGRLFTACADGSVRLFMLGANSEPSSPEQQRGLDVVEL